MSRVDPFSRKLAEAQLVNGIKTACRWRLIDRRRREKFISPVPLIDTCFTDGNGVDEPAAEHEALEVVLEAVRSLPERDQQIFSLHLLSAGSVAGLDATGRLRGRRISRGRRRPSS